MQKPLVIVESPAKAKTIAKFLGKNYVVEASIGHVRDLPRGAADIPESEKKQPWARLGVDTDKDYEPLYVVPKDKKGKIAELKKKLKDASELYLATDEDREGEAISWHLLQLLQPKVPVKRMVFHEITKSAIAAAIENCRDIDEKLVDAQEARRILDRLFGYEISPILWRKIAPKLAAGRVQSVATRLLVERERERMAFVAAAWWDANVTLEHKGTRFPASVLSLDGEVLAQGRDFGADGQLAKGRKVVVLDEKRAQKLAGGLQGQPALVTKVEEKEYSSSPKPPFTTSTLQQEAGRKLGMSAKRAMSAAQSLYQNGFITYMRTDSIALSEQAIRAARTLVEESFGKQFLPSSTRTWQGKSRNAQEAHEAIRPAGESFRHPDSVRGEVGDDEARLYDLIWKRTVASQMVDARMKSVAASFECALSNGGKAELVARGRTVLFEGYLRAYVEGRDESEDKDGKGEDEEAVLPPLAKNDKARVDKAEAAGHSTKPPARYTEASLVQKMEELGIGRPSTYASIIERIFTLEYAMKRGAALIPTPLAFGVVNLLHALEPRLIDYGFTAAMEEELDLIADGKLKRRTFLDRFYKGDQPGLHALVTMHAQSIDPKATCTIPIATHEGKPLVLRVGRYGPYLEWNEQRANLPEGVAPDEITVAKALELFHASSQAEEPLGKAPDGQPVYLRTGRFGPYVQLGDMPVEEEKPKGRRKKGEPKPEKPKVKRASLLKSMSPKTLTLEQALQLLTLPRELGPDVDGNMIRAALGRFGPYLIKQVPGAEKPDYRNLKQEEQLFSTTLEEARAIYAQPKRSRGGRSQPAALKELGPDPATKLGMSVREGKYGVYVSDGETHVTLPKDLKPEDVTAELAVKMLAEKREAGPSKKKSTRKRTARKAS